MVSLPYKGDLITGLSSFWFSKLSSIVPHHMLEVRGNRIMVCKKVEVFPIEFVIRGFLTGVTATSLWQRYQAGERQIRDEGGDGNGKKSLPEGMVKHQALETPCITPTTKSAKEDVNISYKEILQEGLMSKKDLDKVYEYVYQLYESAKTYAYEKGFILVDTKYEFGLDERGEICLCDELHTMDSSRYWRSEGYQPSASGTNREPKSYDKEFLRHWIVKHSKPYQEKAEASLIIEKSILIELVHRYITLYEALTEKTFSYEKPETSEELTSHLTA